MAPPAVSDTTIPLKPVASPSSSNSIMVPHPSKVEPSSENPSTVVSLADIIKPSASEFPPDADIDELVDKLQLNRVDFDPLELTAEQFVAEFQQLLKELLVSGARIPKELMLFVKNFAYLASFIQKMDPDMDLLSEFSTISAGFLTKHGFRVSAELGLGAQDLEVSESSFRRAAGIRDDVEVLTWRDLSNRRDIIKSRLSPTDSEVSIPRTRGLET